MEIIPQVFIFFAQIFSFPFLFFFPFHRFHLSYSISPLAHLIIVPFSRHPPPKKRKRKKQKENGKTANPAASYGICVYQPIMPFSDLFSSQDHSLCARIPPPSHPPPSLITQQRQWMLYFEQQNLLQCYPHTLHLPDC